MPSEIALPFRLDSSGRVVTTPDADAQVHQHVFALLNTHPSERVMVPGYGADVSGLVFEIEDEGDDVSTQVLALVGSAVETWEPGVQIQRAVASSNEDGNVQQVDIDFTRRDAADSGVVANTNVAVIGPGGVVREIVRG